MKTNTQNFKYYGLFLAISASLPLLSNLAATKPIQFGAIDAGGIRIKPLLDAGFLLFPLAYILDDVIAEAYGFPRARRAIWCGAIVMLVGTAYLSFAVWLPAAPGYADQASYAKVFGFLPGIVFGSLLGYLSGSFLNALIVSRDKEKDGERRVGRRLLMSTIWGELVDTSVFCLVYAFLFGLTAGDFFVYLLVGYVWKVFVEAVMLYPVTLPVIRWIKRREGIEVIDRDVHRKLFSLSVQR